MHVPLHATSQHTPSAQKPEPHCAPCTQDWPPVRSPRHWPPLQYRPASQSPSSRHTVWHAPAPSHVNAPHPFSTSVPAGLAEHPPSSPVRLHASHAPPHAPPQHTPSTHAPDAHCDAPLHGAPFPFAPLHTSPAPQLPAGAHAPFTHCPVPHSAPVAQGLPLGLLPTHTPPAQVLPPLHSALPAQAKSQLPLPVHSDAPHSLPGSSPAATGVHAPSRPARLHAMHVPLHATSQHTPSTQNPVAHSPGPAHACPGGLF